MEKVYIVIPAFNEEKTLPFVLKEVKEQGFDNIIVIDDGSSDLTSEVAKQENVVVLKNIINRGLGCALSTGITAAVYLGAEIIVTLDADGQHDPKEIKKLIKSILNKKSEVVIGRRVFKRENTPFTRRIGNKILNILTYILLGVHCNDTQSGFRAFSRKAAKKIKIQTSRMEVSSEIIREIKEKK